MSVVIQKENLILLLNQVLKQNAVLRKGGTQATYFCPFCHHYKRKLEVAVDSSVDKMGCWHCWICDEAGHSIRSLFIKLHASVQNLGELNKLLGESNTYVDFSKYDAMDLFSEKEEKKIDVSLPQEFKSLMIPETDLVYRHAISYVKKRGLTSSDILKYNLGYCEQGEYYQKIIVPSYNEMGDLNFFVGRSYFDIDKNPYKNPEGDRLKDSAIGFDLFVNWNLGWVTLCEGPFDGMAIKRNAIPLFGKTLSTALKKKLLLKKIKRVNIALDNDEPGIEALAKISEELMNYGMDVYYVNMESKDPSKTGFEGMVHLIQDSKQFDFGSLLKLKMGL